MSEQNPKTIFENVVFALNEGQKVFVTDQRHSILARIIKVDNENPRILLGFNVFEKPINGQYKKYSCWDTSINNGKHIVLTEEKARVIANEIKERFNSRKIGTISVGVGGNKAPTTTNVVNETKTSFSELMAKASEPVSQPVNQPVSQTQQNSPVSPVQGTKLSFSSMAKQAESSNTSATDTTQQPASSYVPVITIEVDVITGKNVLYIINEDGSKTKAIAHESLEEYLEE